MRAAVDPDGLNERVRRRVRAAAIRVGARAPRRRRRSPLVAHAEPRRGAARCRRRLDVRAAAVTLWPRRRRLLQRRCRRAALRDERRRQLRLVGVR